MTGLELDLREARVVAAELVEIEHRAMAGVAENDRHQRTIGPRNAQDRDIVIVRPLKREALPQLRNIGLAVGAAIHGEIRAAGAPCEPGVGQPAQCLAGDFDHRVFEPPRVVGDAPSLGVVDPVHRQEVRADHRAAMRV